MKNRNYFLFFVLLLLLSSCAGSDTEAQVDYFPSVDGNW